MVIRQERCKTGFSRIGLILIADEFIQRAKAGENLDLIYQDYAKNTGIAERTLRALIVKRRVNKLAKLSAA